MADWVLTVAGILLIFIVLPVALLRIRDKLTEPSKEQQEEYSRRFRERMQQPDFAGLERHFGHAMPQALIELHRDPKNVSGRDFWVARSADAPNDAWWYIAFYLPLDLETLNEVWGGCEGLLYFADDGCGNNYLVNPREDDPSVQFFDHETGKLSQVCPKLSEFLAWPRFDEAPHE